MFAVMCIEFKSASYVPQFKNNYLSRLINYFPFLWASLFPFGSFGEMLDYQLTGWSLRGRKQTASLTFSPLFCDYSTHNKTVDMLKSFFKSFIPLSSLTRNDNQVLIYECQEITTKPEEHSK